MAAATTGHGHRARLRRADRARSAPRRASGEPRARRRDRALGADELPAAHRALPRRGTLDGVRDRERHERAHHDRRDGRLRRDRALGRRRADRRQLRRHALRLPRARLLPLGAARARVRPNAVPKNAVVRDAARPVGARALGDQLHRPPVREPLQGPRRGRRLLDGDQGRLDHHLRDDRVPHGVACLRVLDRRRSRSEADVLVRADVPARRRVLGRALPRRAWRRGSSRC